jgi:hypothetical protein
MREIAKHFEIKATDPRVPGYYQHIYYEVARDIRKLTPTFVGEARKKMEWQDAVSTHEEATRGR